MGDLSAPGKDLRADIAGGRGQTGKVDCIGAELIALGWHKANPYGDTGKTDISVGALLVGAPLSSGRCEVPTCMLSVVSACSFSWQFQVAILALDL